MIKPVIILDGDDVVLKTGEKKLEWIRKNLQNKKLSDGRCLFDLKSEECNKTLLSPIIGKENYNLVGAYAYSDDVTKTIEPVEGSVEGIKRLAYFSELILLSARRSVNSINERCGVLGVRKYFKIIDSTFNPLYGEMGKVFPKKVEIATYYGSCMLVDDDSQHMPNQRVNGLTGILFGDVVRKETPDFIRIVKDWEGLQNLCREEVFYHDNL